MIKQFTLRMTNLSLVMKDRYRIHRKPPLPLSVRLLRTGPGVCLESLTQVQKLLSFNIQGHLGARKGFRVLLSSMLDSIVHNRCKHGNIRVIESNL